MARRKKFDWVRLIGIGVFIIVAIISFLYGNGLLPDQQTIVPLGENEIHFIDCGQGDSTVILSSGVVTLIDASTSEGGEEVVAYLQKLGVDRIDYFWLSHPHEDHMGGAEAILDAFDVGTIYMNNPVEGTEPTAKFYLNFLLKVKELDIEVKTVNPLETISAGDVIFEVFGPVEEYKDLNNQSIVLKAKWEGYSVLFTGDQEQSAEKDLVAEYGNQLNSTLLKVGHHGSSSSSSVKFLDAVNPEIAVISCGEGNSYGHPNQPVLDRLEEKEALIYRTDQDGTVSFTVTENGFERKESA